jgi:hypothetical protein
MCVHLRVFSGCLTVPVCEPVCVCVCVCLWHNATVPGTGCPAGGVPAPLQTHKTLEGARLQAGPVPHGIQGIVVSTMREAEFFADGGFTDITYGVLLEPSRLARAAAVARRVTLRVLVDSPEAVAMLEACPLVGPTGAPQPWHVWVKVDCGYHRAGRDAAGDAVVAVCQTVAASPACAFSGLYSHSGDSYVRPLCCAGHPWPASGTHTCSPSPLTPASGTHTCTASSPRAPHPPSPLHTHTPNGPRPPPVS